LLDTTYFRTGLKIELDGSPYSIVEFQHVKPGKGPAFVRTKLKNLLNGSVLEHTFRAGEKMGEPDIEEKKMQYLYKDGDSFIFMDNKSYEQISIPYETLGENKANFLKENEEITALFYRGNPVNIDLPLFVMLKIVETDPGVRGDTAQGGTKPAKLETGGTVNVPFFLNEGDKIKIDTRTSEYLERVKG